MPQLEWLRSSVGRPPADWTPLSRACEILRLRYSGRAGSTGRTCGAGSSDPGNSGKIFTGSPAASVDWLRVRWSPTEKKIMKPRVWTTAAMLAVGVLCLAAQPPFSQAVRGFIKVDAPVVALTNARVIDGTGAPAREDQTLVHARRHDRGDGRPARVQPPDGRDRDRPRPARA